MSRHEVTTCDGCQNAINIAMPHLAVTSNLHRVVKPDSTLPFDQQSTIVTGGVVELSFCKPACATKWFGAQDQGTFRLPDPPVPQADPALIPDELVEAAARAQVLAQAEGVPVPQRFAQMERVEEDRWQAARERADADLAEARAQQPMR